MKAEREDRITTSTSSGHHPFFIGILIALAAVALVVLAVPDLRDYFGQGVYFTARLFGFEPPDEFADVYLKLGIAPLSADLAFSSKISPSLAGLVKEPCDRRAIFTLHEALVAAGESRIAANALLGFATECPNSEGEANRAAEIFFQLADNDKVIAITSTLIRNNPTVVNYYYLRGKAMANTKRYPEALADYSSTIELAKNPRDVSERVFLEMANILAVTGKPCEAAKTILAWIAIAPSERNAPNAQKMIEEYQAQGCHPATAQPNINKL